MAVSVFPDGTKVVSGSSDRTIRFGMRIPGQNCVLCLGIVIR